MAKIEPNIQLQKPAQSESAELPATLPENVSFDSKHPLLQIKMKTRTDEKGRECINLTSAQIEEICEYVGEGATTYQRQCGLVTTWQMALQLGDTALALSVLHKMREEATPKHKPKKGKDEESKIQQHLTLNFGEKTGPVSDLRPVRNQMAAARYAPTAPGLPAPRQKGDDAQPTA